MKTGVLQQAWGRFYDQLFYDRQQADYVELVGLEASDVQGALDKTTEPVAILEGLWLRRGER